MFRSSSLSVFVLLCLSWSSAVGQHQHGSEATSKATSKATSEQPVERPRVFLDKSPRVVAYQLKRLNNERLLLVERKTDDAKYAPVFKAILLRAGMSPQYREEALDGLIAVNRSNAVSEVISALDTLDPDDRQQARSGGELTALLLSRGEEERKRQSDAFHKATRSKNSLVRQLGFAGLISIDQMDDTSVANDASAVDMLQSISLVPSDEMRNAMKPGIVKRLNTEDSPDALTTAAIEALGHINREQSSTFDMLMPFLGNPKFRSPTVRTLLKIPADERGSESALQSVKTLVELAEKTPAEQRTSKEFLNAMQLADQLFASIPVADARSYRKRLSEVTVRVVQIHTIEEEMRYDIPYFVVEAGRPVQVVLVNEDLMPHNLVVTTNGSLQEVADLGLAVGPNGGHEGKQYVPNSDKVLFATNMVPPGKSEPLTFTAPTEAGEYPYVCTFPRHWMRMYGVMLVVDDLDAFLQNPIPPKDPLGSTRSYVKSWTVDDFQADLKSDLAHATDEGAKHFVEATCAQCHKANGSGGAVGPELNGVFDRWKGDRAAVLREVLDPSHRIDPKYAVHLVITEDGETVSGIVASEDKKKVSILTNPESKELTVVQRSDIDEIVKTSTSMMPKGLLDRFKKEEILELLAYLGTLKPAAP